MRTRRPAVVWAAAAFIVLILALALVGPWVSPHDPDVGSIRDALSDPSGDHWFGTDYLGRDVFSRIIAGSRAAMIAGFEATAVALLLGVTVGMIIGLAGGWIDRLVMRLIDGISAIPALVLAIAIIASLGSGLTRSMAAVGIAFAMSTARLARGLTLSERERLYVQGARVAGARRRRILRHHIAPNVAGPIAVQATLVFASAVTIEAALSFLSLGVQPPTASWGSMLANAQRTIREAPYQAIPPGVAIVLTVLAINVLGDAVVSRRRGESFDHPTGYLVPTTVTRAVAAAVGPTVSTVGRPTTSTDLLRAHGVTVRYGDTIAVDRVDLDIAPGEIVALVGESGSGKTSLAMTIAGLLTPPGSADADEVRLEVAGGSLDLTGSDARAQNRWRSHVGVVFQEPAASLNPLQTVGRQLRDVIVAQRALRRSPERKPADVSHRIIELLTAVGLREPAEVAGLRPDQISGGMAQRVMIALALAKEPQLLVADEPTTALDVTVQAEIIALLRRLCVESHFAVLLVTHDLGVAGELADRCLVMLKGRIVESAPVRDLALRPKHPYTAELVAAVPQNEPGRALLTAPASVAAANGVEAGLPEIEDLETIAVDEPDHGCVYRLRCPYAIRRCADEDPDVLEAQDPDRSGPRTVACHRADELLLPGVADSPSGPGSGSGRGSGSGAVPVTITRTPAGSGS